MKVGILSFKESSLVSLQLWHKYLQNPAVYRVAAPHGCKYRLVACEADCCATNLILWKFILVLLSKLYSLNVTNTPFTPDIYG